MLNIRSYDIILGADWIYQHSPIGLDLKTRELTICKEGKTMVFKDYTCPDKHCLVDASKPEKIMRKEVMGYMIQVNLIQEEDPKGVRDIPMEVQRVLQQYDQCSGNPRDCPQEEIVITPFH